MRDKDSTAFHRINVVSEEKPTGHAELPRILTSRNCFLGPVSAQNTFHRVEDTDFGQMRLSQN